MSRLLSGQLLRYSFLFRLFLLAYNFHNWFHSRQPTCQLACCFCFFLSLLGSWIVCATGKYLVEGVKIHHRVVMCICEWIEIHDRFAVCMYERIEVQGGIIEVVFVYRRNE